jgi:hypothetical protein
MITARGTAILCIGLLVAPEPYAIAQAPQPSGIAPGQSQTLLSPDQLDSLVAPVALYPDPILSQVLVASTYPVEIVEAARWVQANSNLSGKALADAAAERPWDASVQALVLLPDVLNRLNQEVRWTTDLGNAFLAQEEDVMEAIQRMRQKASANGALESTPQQTVSTVNENNKTFIVIEPASPEVVYVPVYNPVAVWGTPAVYPFPAISYPPYTGIATASALSFGAGMAVGSFWGGGWRGWGWNPGWGRNNIVVNNNFIRSNRFNRVNVGADNRWMRGRERRAGRPSGGRNIAGRPGNRGNNAVSRPTAEQTRQRLGQMRNRRGATGRPSQANIAQRGGRRAGQGSAARMTQSGMGGGRRMHRGGAGQGGANRVQRMNRGRQHHRSFNRGYASRGASGGRHRGAGRSVANRNRGSANRNRGSANRGVRGSSRGGGAGSRGAGRARAGGGSRGGGRRR